MSDTLVFAEVDYTSPASFRRTYFGKTWDVWISGASRDVRWIPWHWVSTRNDAGFNRKATHEWEHHAWSWGPFVGYWISDVRRVAP